ncbi:PREDICTED: sialic acid synthase [Nicrophorus vespilloides]|uniref:Sialic acid synthase n=1 Tax=Nicrophorus vespilloides TaxID=110193 RepID=A0ABM1N8X4_NICVS|nr:PREDICTED: sialic acid synthase [Nicrophorus vespilloides]
MPQAIKLTENVAIGGDNRAFIIAEIGQNHQGDINIAKQLIKVAKECGADCVKFQKTCIAEKFNDAALNREYSNVNSWGRTYGDHKRFLEFSEEQFFELQSYSDKLELVFSASAMDVTSLLFLAKMRVPFIKIGSGDANNFPMLETASKLNLPLIISTGMQSMETVDCIYNIVKSEHKDFVLMHCISSYPTPINGINLNVINLYREKYQDINIGYSGHELGIEYSSIAVAMGAKVIERHLTLDHNYKGSDHACSLEPHEFKQMVTKIRMLEIALGEPQKLLRKSELPCYQKLGKTLVAARDLHKGYILTKDDVKVKVAEPKGLDGCELLKVVGKVLLKDFKEDESIMIDDIH